MVVVTGSRKTGSGVVGGVVDGIVVVVLVVVVVLTTAGVGIVVGGILGAGAAEPPVPQAAPTSPAASKEAPTHRIRNAVPPILVASL